MIDARITAPLFVLGLTAGYIFCQKFEYTRWQAVRFEGQRLIFESAFWGSILTSLSWVTIKTVNYLVCGTWIARLSTNLFLSDVSSLPGLPVFVVCFLYGLALPHFLNVFVQKKKVSKYLYEKQGNELEGLFGFAIEDQQCVAITLKNGKVYIGRPILAPEPGTAEEGFLRILPVLSGHVNKRNGKLFLTTNYQHVYDYMEQNRQRKTGVDGTDPKVSNNMLGSSTEKSLQTLEGLELKHFEKFIRTEEILTANIFSTSVDQRLFGKAGGLGHG